MHSLSIGNPLLAPIDNPKLPVLRLLSRRLQPEHIAPRVRLRDREADELLARQDLGDDFVLDLLTPEV